MGDRVIRTTVLLAAGASSRMAGRDKLLEDVQGKPLILRQSLACLQASDKVIVTLPQDRPKRANPLSSLSSNLELRVVKDASSGLSASFRAVADHDGPILILPCDMPEITATHLNQIWSVFAQAPQKIVQATSADGTAGHPVIFPKDLIHEFRNLSGDVGARSILQKHPERIRKAPLPKDVALIDLDTPDAWASWRDGNSLLRPR